jgi:hypothetical protein
VFSMRYKLAFYTLFWRIPTFNGRDMPHAVSHRSLTKQARVRSHVSPLDVEVDKVALEEVVFRVLWLFSVGVIPPFSTSIALLSEDQTEDTWKTSNREILFLIFGSILYHGSGGYYPTSHREDLGSTTDQSTRDFWWTKLALGQVCL